MLNFLAKLARLEATNFPCSFRADLSLRAAPKVECPASRTHMYRYTYLYGALLQRLDVVDDSCSLQAQQQAATHHNRMHSRQYPSHRVPLPFYNT
jgi:hypothetical protein